MEPRTRWWIIGGLAGAVLVAAVVLIIANRGGAKADNIEAAPKQGTTAAQPTEQVASGQAPQLAGSSVGGHTLPAQDDRNPSLDSVSATGTEIHDHRANPGDVSDRVPTIPSADGKAVFVGRTFAGDVGGLVAPIARECAAKISADARGPKPVIQVQMVVTIKDGKMSIDDVATDFRDVTGDQKDVKDCVKSKASSISIDATGQPDVDHYSITMPMRIAS
ncbi:MAG TPA: hypothetical protein VL463_33180 [Kofleriaceae bacterium]|jgi:hypothetical protein|nr:hypothetical protein [Kofleriaceae bacterium]